MDCSKKSANSATVNGKKRSSAIFSATGNNTEQAACSSQSPQSQSSTAKLLNERRRYLAKAKDALHLAELEAEQRGDELGKKDASLRWDEVHSQGNLISPRPDAYCQLNGEMFHAQKSKMLRQPQVSHAHEYVMNEAFGKQNTSGESFSVTDGNAAQSKISTDLLDFNVGCYFPVQIEVLNALHYQGDDGSQGTPLRDIVTAKMKRLLRTWMTGERVSNLQQLHLHIVDPGIVIQQKKGSRFDEILFVLMSMGVSKTPKHL